MPYTDSRSRADPQAFPFRQLTILAICRICEPIAFMSIFPYIYYMIESFHITDNDKRIALYAGMVTSAFALAEAMSSSIWGRLSDKFGRKLILLTGLAGTGLSMILFGFAQNLQTALIARALGGLLNGNIGVLQTTVAEVVTNEAHQGFAFAIMPTVWCIGGIIGSGLGGSLADPVHNYPGLFSPGTILDEYPYLLPNIVCAMVVVIGIVVGVLFLEETHEDMQDRKDRGLEIGLWIEGRFRKSSRKNAYAQKADYPAETLVLLQDGEQLPGYQSVESSPGLQATAVGLPPAYESIDSVNVEHGPEFPLLLDDGEVEYASREDSGMKRASSVWNALNTQLVLNIVGYGILAYHTISAEQLLPVLFSLPESDSPPTLPFWFTGGFALTTKTIGGILSLQGVIQMTVTMLVFPVLQRTLGTLTTFRLAVLSYPLLYLLVPYLTLVPIHLRMPSIYAILVWKVTAQAFSFPAVGIMLANAIPKRSLGTFNGLAQSSASFSRAIGPSLSGLLEATGLSHGMLGMPWWFNACVALVGATMSLFMVEHSYKPADPEKHDIDEPIRTIPSATSLEINAVLAAAETGYGAADNTMSRPNSPIYTRVSMDIRRNARRGSKT